MSERTEALLDDVLAGRAPNAGRFCGYCCHLLGPERTVCSHCGRAISDWPAADNIPIEVIELHRRRRGREGLVVRTVAWTGLTIGVVLSLLPLAFAGVSWWTVISFFGLMAAFYVLSANLANSVGDELGYRWGQSLFRRGWERFVTSRDGMS